MAKLREIFLIHSTNQPGMELRLEFDNNRFHSELLPFQSSPYEVARSLENLVYHLKNDIIFKETK